MGFVEWIKREIDTSLLVNRRHSEPTIIYFQYHTRDEAYIRALNNFNAWRLEQKEEIRLNISIQEMDANANKKRTESKQVKFKGDNIYEEITPNMGANTSNHASKSKTKSTSKKKISPPKISPKRERKGSRCFKRKDKTSNNNAENINDNRNNNSTSTSLYAAITKNHKDDKAKNPQSTSPPATFYKTNMNPFRNMRTPKIMKSKSNSNNVVDSSSKKKPTIKSPVKSDSGSSDFYRLADGTNGSPLTNVIATPTTPVTDYTNFPSRSVVTVNDKRSSPVEEVTNKYGDIVEYDLPYDCESNQYRCPTNNDAANLANIREFINSSFDFLNDFSKTNDETSAAFITPTTAPQISNRVTDLDKTDSIAKVKDISRSQESILQEFKILEAWSKKVEKDPSATLNENDNGDLADESYTNEMNTTCLAKCYPQNLEERPWCFKNIPQYPAQYSGGKFRDNNVTLKNLINSSSAMRYGENGLWQDLHILRKVRHPDIATLMSVSMNNRQKLIGLVLEPFKCNINELIHNNEGFMPIKDCIDYTLQITHAVIYLQESGYIHSNISSFNVMVCEYKNCVKLTSFELATSVVNIRKKILTAYGLEAKNFKNIDDNKEFLKNCEKYQVQRSNEPLPSTSLTNNDDKTNSKKTDYKIPRKYLPYSVKYRKLYAQHFYQPPELISCYTALVYPLPQSDVYCITLMLWEMLNRCKPFGIFSDLEMEKSFCLNQAGLPIFETERCKLFKKLLSHGLEINPRARIENPQIFKILMDTCKENYIKYLDKTNNNCNNIQSPMDYGKATNNPYALSDILPTSSKTPCRSNDPEYRTSTLKKQPKSIRRNMRDIFNTSEYNSPELMANKDDDHIKGQQHKSEQNQNREIRRKTQDENVSQNGEDEFLIDLDDISLPDTPIARQSKLLKAAWLACSNSGQNSEDQQYRLPTNMNNDDNTTRKTTARSSKRLQLTVKISHNKSILRQISSISQKPIIEHPAEETADEANLESTNVPSQIDFWNSLTAPSTNDVSTAKHDKSRKVSRKTSTERKQEAPSNGEINKALSSPKKISDINERSIYANKDRESDKTTKIKFIPESSRTEEASTSRTISDEHFTNDISPIKKDFETSLWKKEKAKCDSFNYRSPSPSPRLSGLRNPDRLSVKEAVNKYESIHKNNSSSFSSSKILNIENNASASVLFNKSVFGLPSPDNNSVSVEKNTKNENSVISESLQNTEPNKITDNKSEDFGTTNVKNQFEYNNESRRPTSTVSVMTTTTAITRTTSTTSLVALNRTISDSNSIIGSCGGAISRPLSRISNVGSTGNDVVVFRNPKQLIKGEIIGDNNLNCKKINFHCWKCDAPCIILDNPNKQIRSNENSNINRNRHSVPVCFRNVDQQSALTPFHHPYFRQREKSTEDLYIDDDFSQGLNLAANMELGTDRGMQFSDIDFDIFSEQFLNCEETELCLDLEPQRNE